MIKLSLFKNMLAGILILPALLISLGVLAQSNLTVFAELATPSDQLVVTPLPTPSEPAATPSATLAPSPTEAPDVTPSATLSPTPTTEPSTTPTSTLTPTEAPDSEPEPSTQSATTELQEMEVPSRLPKQDPDSATPFEPEYVPGEVLVQYKSDFNPDSLIGKIQMQMLTSSADVEVAEQVATDNLILFEIKSEKSVEETVSELEQSGAVEFAQPNYIYRTQNIGTNDTYANDMWALKNVGQTVYGTAGTNDADIDGSEAWEYSTGSNVIVAVIDDGVYYTHPDLQANMWDGSSCKSDANTTLGGCVHGYDYMDNDKTPLPSTGNHGTHIAGTIAAVKNNSTGVAGVAPSAKIMAIKTYLTTTGIVKSINFARYNGAKIINASWGGYGYDSAVKSTIDNYPGLFVTSAGNGGFDQIGDNNDTLPSYPCSFTSTNIICVAASTQSDGLTSFSNYGTTSVDIAAPGVNILSTYSSFYAYNQGTSMAAPHVAGAAALVYNIDGTLSANQVKNILTTTGDAKSAFASTTVSGKRLNAFQATIEAEKALKPVYRFWSDQNQAHFYTAFEDEKNLIIATYPENVWRYEGVAYYVYPSTTLVSSDPIYRFWSDQNQAHFYTAFEDEKNLIIATYPENVWRYEGIAFKAPK